MNTIALPYRETSPKQDRRDPLEGHGMHLLLLTCVVLQVIAAVEFDPTKWAQFAITTIIAASGVVSVVIWALRKTIRELRTLRDEIRQMPEQVSKVIDDSDIPTTPAQVKQFAKTVAVEMHAEQQKQADKLPQVIT
jgi:hypothetical protein